MFSSLFFDEVLHFLKKKNGQLHPSIRDEIIRGTTLFIISNDIITHFAITAQPTMTTRVHHCNSEMFFIYQKLQLYTYCCSLKTFFVNYCFSSSFLFIPVLYTNYFVVARNFIAFSQTFIIKLF